MCAGSASESPCSESAVWCETTLESKDGLDWWTFAGGGANLLLARMLEHELGSRVTSDDYSLRFEDNAGESAVALRQALAVLRARSAPTADDCAKFALGEERKRYSKFDQCLPDDLLGRLVVESNLDVEGARRALARENEPSTIPSP
jgi:ATP-dependent helicase Lhr and Lhr-like helicase